MSLARYSTGINHTESRTSRVITTRIWRMKTELGERLRLNHWMSRGSGAVIEIVSELVNGGGGEQ